MVKNKDNKRQAFKDLCYNRKPEVWNDAWVGGGSGIPKIGYNNICRYCNKSVKEDDFCITYSYWSTFWYPSHKKCKEEGEKKEAYECQKIDSACNDCFYFKRDIKNSCKVVYMGICDKNKCEVETSRNFCENKECFLHRLDGKSNDKSQTERNS